MGQVRYGQKNVARPREKNDFEKVKKIKGFLSSWSKLSDWIWFSWIVHVQSLDQEQWHKGFYCLNFNDCKSLFYTVECAKCHKNRNIVNYGPNFENPKICIWSAEQNSNATWSYHTSHIFMFYKMKVIPAVL